MTRTRVLAMMWLAVAVVIWNVYFDLWMSGAPREYLLQSALWELGRGAEPDMASIMRLATRDGAIRASWWAALILSAGLMTLRSRK
ncbi:MAG: hypothetical protein HQ485_01860 [Acidobacteria bacterium]|jgi:hypothetical protein|nr:hypothetical protein [Acidobacteriota bacterium]